ncbi:hypothetical protein IOD13_08040 [Brevibacterium casei]|nr:hypothetical protein [Brevibacterium casei]
MVCGRSAGRRLGDRLSSIGGSAGIGSPSQGRTGGVGWDDEQPRRGRLGPTNSLGGVLLIPSSGALSGRRGASV